MFNEAPNGVPKQAIEVQRFFCRTACDISNIVGHTCGVERAGKAYKLMTPNRKRMEPKTSKKAVFIS